METILRDKALAEAQWERKNVINKLDDRGISHLNPHYVDRELIDDKRVYQ